MMLLLLGIGAVLLGANSWKGDLRVASVVVLGTRIIPASDIVTLSGVTRGEKLFSVDLGGVKRRVERNPYVHSASVQRDAPDRITITLEEREPLSAAMGDHLMYLDPDGYVLPAVRSAALFDLPVVTGTIAQADCIPGRPIAVKGIQEALKVLQTAKAFGDETYRRISEIHVEDQRDMVLYTVEQGIPVILGHGNEAEKLAKLEGFWTNVVGRRGTQGLEYVDLRFEDQVVVRWARGQGNGLE